MTKGFQFTLPLAGTDYNLWDLIAATAIDPTTYMPKAVCQLNIKFPLLAANAGAYLSVKDKLSGQQLNYLVSDASHVASSHGNNINLDSFVLNGDTNNVVVDISFVAR